MPILVFGSWHVLPRLVFSSILQLSRGPYSSEAFFQNLFCSSLVEHLQAIPFNNNVGGDNHVVTFSIDRRLWLVYKAGDVGGKYDVVRE
jgi:hypothetical protein